MTAAARIAAIALFASALSALLILSAPARPAPARTSTPPHARTHARTITLKTLWFSCPVCRYCGTHGTTHYGRGDNARARPGIIAVDPRYIPIGTRLSVPGVGVVEAWDTGGDVRGMKGDVYTNKGHRWNNDNTRHGVVCTVLRWGKGRR